jgi:putative acyl-CoA dehydrogenase
MGPSNKAQTDKAETVTEPALNQPPPLVNYNLFDADAPLREALEREGAAWAQDMVRDLGRLAGTEEAIAWGFQANANPPQLRSHDRFGNRIDEVEFHPAWHRLMEVAIGHGLHALPWREPRPGAHAARAAAFYVWSQVEPGHGCPVSMTYAAVPALRKQPDLAAEWEPLMTTLDYDPGLRPHSSKRGVLFGMALTERQGGSDVRSNTTRATPTGSGGEYQVTGDKWFCSAPMCDAFLVLAQADGGLSCFLMPRWTPDGERNRFHLQRLKDKLGNRSNASSEVEFRAAWARLIGEEGRGVPTIIEMVNHTRLDCVIGSTAGMRAGVAQATWHAAHRSAFGKLLAEQPLMQNVLADLCVESEAATISSLRLARAYDEAAAGDETALRFRRLANAVLKYWICKRGPVHAVEALECLGGNGYVEESGMPRLYRESPLSSIWEGSGNVQCLDVLRAMVRHPESVEAFANEVGEGAVADPRLDEFAGRLRDDLSKDPETMETRARQLVERMALALQGSLLVRFGDPAVADAFCASRLGNDWGSAFGTLPAGTDFKRIVERHTPADM